MTTVPLDQRLMRRLEFDPNSGCWLWSNVPHHTGYGHLVIRVRGQGRVTVTAHRLSWELHRGPIPPGMQVLHHCDMRLCANPDHLFLGTNADNVADRHRKGRSSTCRGERSPHAFLTDAAVREMRRRRSFGEPYKTIAPDFGISANYAGRICVGLSWAHVQ